MVSMELLRDKYLKQEGIDSLTSLLDSYLKIFNDKQIKYPLTIQFWGFPVTTFDHEYELYGRVKLVSEIACIPIKIKLVEQTLSDNSKKIACFIEKEII